MARVRKNWRPPPKISTTDWSRRFRTLSAEESARPGRFRDDMTPWLPFIQDALDDPAIWKVVCMKSAQVAWTTALLNWLGKLMHSQPSPVIGMFAKTEAAKEFREEKLAPMIRATRVLREIIDVVTTRRAGSRWNFLRFPGGFLKLVGSNSPTNVKSTPAPRVFVEEPDDASENVGKQGDSIKLLEERTKTYDDRKVVFGGTPSVKGLSTIEAAYLVSDQRVFEVPCHDCGEYHVLAWDNVKWHQRETGQSHPVYGMAMPETAFYACPHCGSAWDDRQKNLNVRRLRPMATQPFAGVAGFYINELYAMWGSSRFSRLVERFLEAQSALDQGDDSDMIVFVNSALGLPYEFQGERLESEALRELAAASDQCQYRELWVPDGGLLVSGGIDVQHDRLSILLRAWGRDEESWLLLWVEIYGNTVDKNDPVWEGLDKILFGAIPHACGAQLRVVAATIDSSDGGTSDAVYHYVRTRQSKMRWLMAGKGASNDYGNREIFAKPKESIDTKGQNNIKAAKYGLRPYIVGTHKAKDLIHARLKLGGRGAGRMHAYKDVRADYWDQLTGEVKAPHRRMRGKRIWQKKSGAAVEALDCEVYSLHAARAAKVHLMTDVAWADLERQIKQADLFRTEPVSTGQANGGGSNALADLARKLNA